MSNLSTQLIQLRQHYQHIVMQSRHQASQARRQLTHIDALLSDNRKIQSDLETTTTLEHLAVAPTLPAASAPTVAAVLETSEAGDERKQAPRSLVPPYSGLKRLDAIAQALQTALQKEVKVDYLTQVLFGSLTPAEQKSEQKRLKTLLYLGERRGLWKKGKAPSTYIASSAEPTKQSSTLSASSTANQSADNEQIQPETTQSTSRSTPARTQSKRQYAVGNRTPLPLLPAYEGMTKLEAIAKVLSEKPGRILHQNSIFQLLYGNLSPQTISAESRRMRASLFQGVQKGLWQRSLEYPSSYVIST